MELRSPRKESRKLSLGEILGKKQRKEFYTQFHFHVTRFVLKRITL